MVYDCFSFFNEMDLLEIRLNVLDKVVDKFVLVEATKTHSNKDKPLYYWENRDRYKQFHDKIIYIKVDTYPPFKSSWTYENHQRNMILEGLKNCAPDDIIMISDLDEIPNPDAVKRYDCDGIKTLEQSVFTCYLNYKSLIFSKWYGTNILCYKHIQNSETEKYPSTYSNTYLAELNQGCTPTKIRMIRQFPIIKKGGWHFTYLGGVEKIQYKLDSFAHQEFNRKEFVSSNIIEQRIKHGQDLINPCDNRCIPVRIGKKFPLFVVDNINKYSSLIYPVTASVSLRNVWISLQTYLGFYFLRFPRKKLRQIKKKLLKWQK